MSKIKRITVIVPIFNEEKNIGHLQYLLNQEFEKFTKYTFEVLLINDGSRDSSWIKLQNIIDKDPRYRGISFSRNFGHQMALTAGYDFSRGDAVISLDADMQDPPELISQMIMEWENGYDIVYARRISRSDGFFKDTTAALYYWVLDQVSDIKIPRNVGDFRLIGRKVLKQIQACHERFRYLRGMVAWVGFTHTFIDFVRPERVEGVTGYTWKKLFKLAFDGITSFSLFPLKLAAYAGSFVVATGSCMFVWITYDALINHHHYPLFKWLTVLIYMFMGVQFFLLWLLGEYIGRMYDQQKNRPLYIIQEMVNMEKNENNANTDYQSEIIPARTSTDKAGIFTDHKR